MRPADLKLPRLAAFLVLALSAGSFASGYFLDEDMKPAPVDKRRPFSFGFGLGGAYYASEFDAQIQANAQYRVGNHAFGAFVGSVFTDDTYEFGLDYRWYFLGERESVWDDFFAVAFSGVLFEKFDDYYFAPRIGLAYGRDLRPFKASSFAVRFTIGGSYLIGEALARETTDYTAQEAHTVLYVQMGLLF